AVRGPPEAASSRLVLADWLPECGDDSDRARADFIRAQCQLAGPGPAPRGLRSLLARLLTQYAADWLGPLAAEVEGFRFERGLLRLDVHGFRMFLARLLDLLPTETFAWVEGLTIRHMTGGRINP